MEFQASFICRGVEGLVLSSGTCEKHGSLSYTVQWGKVKTSGCLDFLQVPAIDKDLMVEVLKAIDEINVARKFSE